MSEKKYYGDNGEVFDSMAEWLRYMGIGDERIGDEPSDESSAVEDSAVIGTPEDPNDFGVPIQGLGIRWSRNGVGYRDSSDDLLP